MKYMGSKNRIAKHILPIVLKDRKEGQWYVEPFVGGANMIDKVDGLRLGADNNIYLIELYRKLQNGYIPREFISRDQYYDIKANKDKYPMEVVALCGVLASYNGNWFRAYGGYSKTKTGKDRNYYQEGVRNLMSQLPFIQDVVFKHSEYFDLDIPLNSIVYCDPPYQNTDKTYKDKKFDYEYFWEWVREKSKHNTVFVSELSAPEDFECVWSYSPPITHPRQVKASTERLFKWNPDK